MRHLDESMATIFISTLAFHGKCDGYHSLRSSGAAKCQMFDGR